jgi:hypothetical protein
MTSLDKTVDAIGRIAAEFPRLYREAARQHGVEVESIVQSGSRDVARIERTLDGLLDFAADRECLELFRRLCRHYWNIDPAATAGYVHAYREMWDSDAPGEEDSKE